MTIASCPRCTDDVRIPAHASPKALVRCPLCREQFTLSELLSQAPPLLEILDDPEPLSAPAAAPASRAAAAVATEEPAAEEYQMAGGGAGVFDTTGPAGMAVGAPSVSRGVPRRKKKEGSAIGMALQVVLGGVGAFILACPTVWWIKGDDDPFGVAQYVEPYAPWIIPPKLLAKLRKSSASNNAASGGAGGVVTPPPPANGGSQPAGGGKKNQPTDFSQALAANNPGFGAEAPADPLDPLQTIAPEPKPAGKGVDLSALDPEPIPETTTPAPNPSPNPAPNPTPNPITPNPAPFAPDPAANPQPPMPTPAPTPPAGLTPVDVRAAINKADAAEQDFTTFMASPEGKTDAATRAAKGTAMYNEAARLGDLVAQIDLNDIDYLDHGPLVQEYGAKLRTYVGAVRALGGKRFANPPEGDSGIALVGKVTGFKAVDKMFETALEVNGQTLSIVSNQNPEGAVNVDDEVIVLGRVLRDPKKEWPAYKGDAAVVVRLGYWTTVAEK
jgi:hypothetical protein